MHNLYNQVNKYKPQLFEGLEFGDLARLIHPKLHIDEFKSKMGEDADIMVLSFKITEKQPANDLMNFIERGYDWVLDADVSTGELDDGDYLVFVEIERNPRATENIINLVSDILNLTEQKMSDWRFQYRKNKNEFSLDEDYIKNIVPLTPDRYIEMFGQEELELDDDTDQQLDAMKAAARVKSNKKAPVNEYTDHIRIAAGLK